MKITNQRYNKEKIVKELGFTEDFPLYGLEEMKRKEGIARREELLREKPQQVACALPNEPIGIDCVQSYVSNMSAPNSLEELFYEEGLTLPENLLSGPENEWTAPRWAKAGDVVFFMHSKTAISTITKLRTELLRHQNEFETKQFDQLKGYLDHAREVHRQYGGKIFAVGRVCGGPEYAEAEEFDSIFHWKSRCYAKVDNIQALAEPIDIAQFRDYIYISRGSSVTPLFDQEFDRLRADIGRGNDLPVFLKNSVARPVPLRLINERNWIEVAKDFRRSFILEKQFRKFYVDYLLREIGDQKRFFTECRCQRPGMNDSFMDYVILFGGKYLPVETKLSAAVEPNLKGQVSKYVYNSSVYLKDDGSRTVSGEEFHDGKVLIIDTEKVYIYDAKKNSIDELYDLANLVAKEDLEEVKRIISSTL